MRSTLSIPAAFPHPDNTSVFLPMEKQKPPLIRGKISSRSSTTATQFLLERRLMMSRSNVVLPLPGFPMIKTELSALGTPAAIPGKSRATRKHKDVSPWMLVIEPEEPAAFPHRPILCPPGAVIYPLDAVSAVHGEY